MSRILDDLQEIPQDWFDELAKDEQPNKDELQSVDVDLYQSECPGLLGNMVLELFLGKDGFYYMLMQMREPIGDYGMHWVDYWYKRESQYISEIEEILKGGVLGNEQPTEHSQSENNRASQQKASACGQPET